MAHVVVPQRGGGYAPQESDWDTYIRGNLNEGWALFGKTDPNGGTAALTFQSIPQTHKHLRIVWYGRTVSAATSTNLTIRLNGDATAGNYDNQQFWSSGAVLFATEGLGNNGMNVVPSSLARDNSFGAGVIDIPHYTGANHKALVWLHGAKFNDITNAMRILGGALFWRNTAAVTSIDIVSTAVFAVGSRISVYGLG